MPKVLIVAMAVVALLVGEQTPQFAMSPVSWQASDPAHLQADANRQGEGNVIFVQGGGNGCNAGGNNDSGDCDPGNSAGNNCGGDETQPDKCKNKPGSGGSTAPGDGSGGTGSGDASGNASANASAARQKGKGASLLAQAINFGYLYPAFVEPTLIAPGELVQVHFKSYVKNFQQFLKLECRDLIGEEIFMVGTYIGEIVGCGSSMLILRTWPGLPDGEVTITLNGLGAYSFTLNICGPCANALSETQAEQALSLGYVPMNLILFLDQALTDPAQIQALLAQYGLGSEPVQAYRTVPGYVKLFVRVQTGVDLAALQAQLAEDGRIRGAFFERLISPAQVSDPDFSQQFFLQRLNLPQGWDVFFKQRGQGVVLGVLDSGVDFEGSPEEFVYPGCAPLGYDFSTAYPAPGAPTSSLAGLDNIGHGTAVAALAGAANNSAQGVGVAPEVLLVSLKVFSRVGQSSAVTGTLDDVAKALQLAYQLGVDVVNMSVGCQGCDEQAEAQNLAFYRELFDRLAQGNSDELIFSSECTTHFERKTHKPIIVAAAGNDGVGRLDSPAILPETISVGSVGVGTNGSVARSAFSNYGQGLDFMAEGESLMTTNLNGAFGSSEVSGTSFSAPQVAGLVALILSQEPGLSLEDVKARIINCFIQDLGAAGWDEQTGFGRIYFPAPGEAPASCLSS